MANKFVNITNNYSLPPKDTYRQAEYEKVRHARIDRDIRRYNNERSIGIFNVIMVVMLLFLIGNVLSNSTSIPTFEGVLQVFKSAPLIDTTGILGSSWGVDIPILNELIDFINLLGFIGASAVNMLGFIGHFIGYIFSL